MKNILVVGSSNIDYVISTPTIPRSGETVIGNQVDIFPGGKGANQAIACGLLGGVTSFLSCLGQGGHEALLDKMFSKSGINTSKIKRDPTLSTGAAYISVDQNGQNSITVIPGANQKCSKAYIENQKELFELADIVLVQMEIPLETVECSLTLAKEKGKTVILNPAPAPDVFNMRWLELVDYLTPNETELEKITGKPVSTISEIELAAKQLLVGSIQAVVVTLGKRGALLMQRDFKKLIPPPYIDVVDTTAAGDVFNGAFAVALAEGRDPEDAIEFANIASTITVSRRGAQSSIPTRFEVDSFPGLGVVQ